MTTENTLLNIAGTGLATGVALSLCPACGGKGRVLRPYASRANDLVTCQLCGGKGKSRAKRII